MKQVFKEEILDTCSQYKLPFISVCTHPVHIENNDNSWGE